METRHVELERFARKADGYKAALDGAPEARALEVTVTAALLRGLFNERGWDPATTPIVELMSGTGYLSEHLTKAGFKRVTSVEACHEMLPADGGREGLVRKEVHDISEAKPIVRDIQPAVIVSMAGFHHLIQYESPRHVDRFRSVLWQSRVVEEFLPFVRTGGLFLIVDIVEPSADAGRNLEGLDFWDPTVFRTATVLPESMRNSLARTKSIVEYDRVVGAALHDPKDNATIHWFRHVVDPSTSLGHDDVALSSELLEILSWHHNLRWATFRCPWVFESENQLKFFLPRKFGYLVDRKPAEVDLDDLLQKAKTHAGLHQLGNGRIAFGWNLAALAVLKTAEGGSRSLMNEAIIVLSCITCLLAARIGLRLLLPDFFASIAPHYDGLLFIGIGMLASTVLQWFLQRKS